MQFTLLDEVKERDRLYREEKRNYLLPTLIPTTMETTEIGEEECEVLVT